MDGQTGQHGARGGPALSRPVSGNSSSPARVFNPWRGGVAAYPQGAGGKGGGPMALMRTAVTARPSRRGHGMMTFLASVALGYIAYRIGYSGGFRDGGLAEKMWPSGEHEGKFTK